MTEAVLDGLFAQIVQELLQSFDILLKELDFVRSREILLHHHIGRKNSYFIETPTTRLLLGQLFAFS